MSKPVVTYLEDHLAGAVHAIDLLEFMRHKHVGETLGQFCSDLVAEIEADREVLRGLAERLGGGSSALKEMGSWLSEKLSRIKLGDQSPGSLGTFEALEFLQLGIHGKLLLWQALAVVAQNDIRLQTIDLAHLEVRAETQENQVAERRLEAARLAFMPGV